MIDMNKTVFQRVADKSLLRFLLVGGMTTLIDYIIYFALSQRLNVIPAKFCSMMCSTLFAFFINKSWTFQCKEQGWLVSLKKYYLTQAANMTVNISVNAILFWMLQRKTLAFIGATVAGMSVNYLLQKYYVFRKKYDRSGGD